MKKLFLSFLLAAFGAIINTNAQSYDFPKAWQATPAFPSAEGFGKFASGGRGGIVVTVTTLEDDAENPITGSLRWAVKQYPNEPITVVFNVSGWIILKDVLRINRSTGITIAGQTAPGEGITIYPRMMSINGAKNVIIRNMRFRNGSKGWDGSDLVKDIQGTLDQAMCAENAENVIFDHCTFGWSAEEIVNNQTSHLQTYQYCILHEGLYDAGHHKGSARSFGCQWGGGQSTFHHNMLIHNYSRSPRIQGARKSAGDIVVYNEFLNNVIYNWGRQGAAYGGENDQDGAYSGHQVNYCNNYYKPGPATKRAITNPASYRFMSPSHATMVAEWHFSGNYMEGNATITADNNKGVVNENPTLIKLLDHWLVPEVFYPGYRFDYEKYTYKDKMQTAEEAYQDVLAKVGCLTRDNIEKRLIKECTDGTATYGGTLGNGGIYGIIDDPLDAEMEKNANGSYYFPGEKKDIRPAGWDTDGDGMPDAWEDANGFDKNNAADGNYVNAEGYTALEKYLAELMGETIDGTFTAPDRFFRIVAKDGSGEFTSVQAAVDACAAEADKSVRHFIFIKNGIYEEQVTIPQNVVLTMLGESRDGVRITRAKSHAEVDDEEITTTMYIHANDFYGENFTVENTAGPTAGQAEALTNNGDRMTLKNVAIKGNQDGLRFNDSSRSYLYKCYVEGTVDYIFDSGIAFLDSCEIKQVNKAGYIVAPGDHYASIGREVSLEKTGFSNVWGLGLFLRNCTLTADATIGNKSSHLGRNWGKRSSAAYFINCRMGNHISDVGFVEMSAGATRYLGEYGSMDLDGNKLDLSKRVSWSITDNEAHNPQIMTSALINNLFNTEYVYALGAEQSIHCSGVYAPKPMVASPGRPNKITKTDGQLSWTKAEGAKGYLIYKNGRFFALATTNSFNDASYSEGDVYTLRSMSVNGSLSLVAETDVTYNDTDDTPVEGVEDDGIFPGGGNEPESTANTDGAKTNYSSDMLEHYAAESFESGSGTADDPYIIMTVEQLMKLAVEVENKGRVAKNWGGGYTKGKYYALGADLDLNPGISPMSGITWRSSTELNFSTTAKDINYVAPAGIKSFGGIGYYLSDQDVQYFAGTFDGRGHTIKGLYIKSGANGSGIFNRAEGAVIKNLIVEDGFISANNALGFIVGNAKNSTILNCEAKNVGTYASGSNTGGIAGIITSSSILNCSVTGTNSFLQGKDKIGGICGGSKENSTISNCFFQGSVAFRYWTSPLNSAALRTSRYLGAVCPEFAGEASNCFWLSDSKAYNLHKSDASKPLAFYNLETVSTGTITNCLLLPSVSQAVNTLNETRTSIGGAYAWTSEGNAAIIDFSSTATGISGITAGNRQKDVIYTIQGVRMAKPVRGINIINGRKVIVR